MLSGLFSITLLPTKRKRGDKPDTSDLLQVIKESTELKKAATQTDKSGTNKGSAELQKPSRAHGKPSAAHGKPSGHEQTPPPPGTVSKATPNNSSRVLRKIIADSKAFLDQNKTKAPPPEAVRSSMIAVVNQTFTVMQSCAEELNDVLGPTELWISCTAPTSVTESETISTFRGRISSNLVSIVIRGQNDRVDFLMMPADRVIGLSIAEKQYPPLMTFILGASGTKFSWQVEGKPLTEERLERYCVELFRFFVEETRAALKDRSVLATVGLLVEPKV
jgi:hypothetical protein